MEFEYSKNETVDTLDNIPEAFRGVYVEGADKKFSINPSLKSLTTAMDGLNTALRAERKSTQTLKGQKDVAAVIKESFGLDTVDDVKAKIQELTDQVTEKSKVDPAKIKADIEKAFLTKEEGYKADKAKMQSTLDRYLIDAAATSALAEAKGNVKLLLPIIKQATEVVADGEDYVVRIKDGSGDYRGNGAGGFMSVADLVKELKASADYGVAFASEAPKGGGKTTGQSTQQSRQTMQRQNGDEPRSAAQRIKDGLEARRRA